MLDFLKLRTFDIDTISQLLNSQLLTKVETKERYSSLSGDIIQHREVYEFKGISFCFEKDYLDIAFKPHYYFNKGKHNANDFCVEDCIKVQKEIIDLFQFKSSKFEVLGIEFGLNFNTKFTAEKILNSIVLFGRDSFRLSNDNLGYSLVGGSINKKGKISSYKRVKLYAKHIHLPKYCENETLRYEIHSRRKIYIQSKGINSWFDLLKFQTYKALSKTLLNEFDSVLILDYDSGFKNLSSNEVKQLKEQLTPKYWLDSLKKHRNTFNNNKKSYIRLLNKTGNNIHNEIKNKIKSKLVQLDQPCADLTPTNEVQCCAGLIVV